MPIIFEYLSTRIGNPSENGTFYCISKENGREMPSLPARIKVHCSRKYFKLFLILSTSTVSILPIDNNQTGCSSVSLYGTIIYHHLHRGRLKRTDIHGGPSFLWSFHAVDRQWNEKTALFYICDWEEERGNRDHSSQTALLYWREKFYYSFTSPCFARDLTLFLELPYYVWYLSWQHGDLPMYKTSVLLRPFPWPLSFTNPVIRILFDRLVSWVNETVELGGRLSELPSFAHRSVLPRNSCIFISPTIFAPCFDCRFVLSCTATFRLVSDMHCG